VLILAKFVAETYGIRRYKKTYPSHISLSYQISLKKKNRRKNGLKRNDEIEIKKCLRLVRGSGRTSRTSTAGTKATAIVVVVVVAIVETTAAGILRPSAVVITKIKKKRKG